MTKTKALKILNNVIESQGDSVLWYLVDFYKKKLCRIKREIEEDTHNFAQDPLDYKCGEVKVSDIARFIESGKLAEYCDTVRKIQKGGCSVPVPCKEFEYVTVKESEAEYQDYYSKHEDKIKKIYDKWSQVIKQFPY